MILNKISIKREIRNGAKLLRDSTQHSTSHSYRVQKATPDWKHSNGTLTEEQH